VCQDHSPGGTTGIAKVVNFDQSVTTWVHITLLKIDKSKVEPLWLEAMLNLPFCYQQSQRLTRRIANRDLGLTRSMGPAGRTSGLVIQALRHLAQKYVDDAVIQTLQRKLSDKDKKRLIKDIAYAPAWVGKHLREIARGKA
jgi:hypothetical protein